MMLFPLFVTGKLYTTANRGKSTIRGREKGGGKKKGRPETGRPKYAMPGPARDAAEPRDGLTHQII